MKKFFLISIVQIKAHKASVIIFLFGYLISVIFISIGVSSIEQQKNMILESSEGLSKNTVPISINGRNKEIFNDLNNLFNLNNEERILIKGLKCYIDKSNSINEPLTAEYFLSKPNWRYPLKDGRYYTADEVKNGKKVALIGNMYSDFTYKIEGQTKIKLSGEEYDVIGIIGSKNNNKILNEKIVVPITALPNGVKNDEDINCKKLYLSNLNGYPIESGEKIKENLIKSLTTGGVEYFEEKQVQDIKLDLSKQPIFFISGLIYLISIINMVNLSYYWLNDRRKEIAIKKAFGISNKNICTLIYFEFLSLISLTTMLALIVQAIFKLLSKNLIGISLELTLNNFLLAVLISVISALFAAFIPMIKSLKVQPIEALKL